MKSQYLVCSLISDGSTGPFRGVGFRDNSDLANSDAALATAAFPSRRGAILFVAFSFDEESLSTSSSKGFMFARSGHRVHVSNHHLNKSPFFIGRAAPAAASVRAFLDHPSGCSAIAWIDR